MKLLVAYDQWCEGRVRALLLFLEEWLSISQKYAERGMIVLYLVLMYSPPYAIKTGLPIAICGPLFMGSVLWSLHRRPESMRTRGKFLRKIHAHFRVGMQVALGILAAFDLTIWVDTAHNGGAAAAQFVYLVFFYAIDITSNGERGRRCKLAWTKIKELFGTEWIPKPVTVPQ